MIKSWTERMMSENGFCEPEAVYMQAEIDELRAKLAALEQTHDQRFVELTWLRQHVTGLELQEPAGFVDADMEWHDAKGFCVMSGTKLFLAASAAPVNEWRDAVLDALASHAMDAPLTDTPQQIVKKLLDMVATMARDPAINAGAAPVPEGYVLLSVEAIKRTLNCLNTPERADLRLVLRDLYAAASAANVPEGWQLVPIEPTDDELAVGVKAMRLFVTKNSIKDFRLGYKAMLDAASKEQP